MPELYSEKVCELSKESTDDALDNGLSYLSSKEKDLLTFLLKNRIFEFTPIDISKKLGVTNKTVINRCAKLASNGFLIPNITIEAFCLMLKKFDLFLCKHTPNCQRVFYKVF